ncbi:NAD(P)-dependent dehydrogenase (short-subunit alcohol dehydrogenase family) [Novosphingobium sp. PhB165]|uniref:SDR family NAD(P)-dependent oxidoreductase n=1 Tax=Novosphingobium sp. PhB165 TaxID=2485105 RepID=UPI00104E888D|nr:SDR family oxidoreductase [Novosphingobium sp. PhB165]TCM14654.1 NAD(P)-dependent dehydrogenase (short-subunit alcohol dehydrogenase family) [Novosphingobium sp. PhB165]
MLFAGKKVLITGAASGIGRATAIRFAAEGAAVTIGDRNAAGLEETAALMASTPTIQTYDATDLASCRALVDVAARDGLDVLCNIAGMLKWGSSETFSLDDFELLLKINTTSVFALCQAALPHLVKSGGNIVNTASTAALQGIAYTIAYSASKHGVAAITKGLAIEYGAKGVRVNAICPGHVETPMTRDTPVPEGDIDWSVVMRNAPKLRDGSCSPDDVANMFAFLASDQASKVTGALFTVDGGQLAG